jgi:chitin synthase
VLTAQFILESFGNAHTVTNDNASRSGSYNELQFNDRGRLEGLKTIDYYFERSRVSQPPASGERNFHVFYYLVAGIEGEERQHLHLQNFSDYRYLQSRARRTGPSDRERFHQLKNAFRAVGLSNRLVAQLCQLLAAIVHIGNLQFTEDVGMHEGAIVMNPHVLGIVAEFLGVSDAALSEIFSFKTVLVRKEVCTTFLDPEQAESVRDELARTLYSLLFSWLNEHLNQKLCKDSFGSFLALVDFPGLQNNAGPTLGVNSVDQFCFNFANEKEHNWILHRIHEVPLAEALADQLPLERIPYFDNTECIKMLSDPKGGLITIADEQAKRKRTDQSLLDQMNKRYMGHASFQAGNVDRNGSASFTVQHYGGPVSYSIESFVERNANETSADILRLLRGTSTGTSNVPDHLGSNNPFIRSLFSSRSIATQAHPRNDNTIVAAQQPVRPMRTPSVRRKQRSKLSAVAEEEDDEVGGGNETEVAGTHLQCVAGQHWAALQTLFSSFDQAQPWYTFCLRPNDSQLPAQMETRSVKAQIRSMGLTEIALRLRDDYEVRMTHEEFVERYHDEFAERAIGDQGTAADRMRDLKRVSQLSDTQMAVGSRRVFLSHAAFHRFEDRLREQDGEPARPQLNPRDRADPFAPGQRSDEYSGGEPMFDYHGGNDSAAALPLVLNAQPVPLDSRSDIDDDTRGGFAPSQATSPWGDAQSNVGSESYAPSRNMFRDMENMDGEKDVLDNLADDNEVVEVYKESAARRRWVWLCWSLTWWCPNFLLDKVGRMKRQDIRQAWREKLAINMIIWFICGCTAFVIAGLGQIICPRQHVYTQSERESHDFNGKGGVYVSIRGEVFDLTSYWPTHQTAVSVVPATVAMKPYGGKDVSILFPVQVSALCGGTRGAMSPYVTLDNDNTTDPNTGYHDFRHFTNDSRPDWYLEQMTTLRSKWRVGWMGYTRKDIKFMANSGRIVGILDDYVYDLTTYKSLNNGGAVSEFTPSDQRAQANADRSFMAPSIVETFRTNPGQDVSDPIKSLEKNLGPQVLQWQRDCLRNLFIIGKVDTRDSTQCQFSTYILLALSCVMVAVIGFKFIASLHFGPSRAPENHDKFVICQVPCYTEGDDSLRRTIDSLAKLRYDDKLKLLFIICDGNIKGYGNEKPTPAIVCDILGVDPNLDPEPLSFQSLGEGSKQHNMGKVYAGLYECSGHVVPYVICVKVGKPTERPKPGNRGKRDSQMLLMHFLNKVSSLF